MESSVEMGNVDVMRDRRELLSCEVLSMFTLLVSRSLEFTLIYQSRINWGKQTFKETVHFVRRFKLDDAL